MLGGYSPCSPFQYLLTAYFSAVSDPEIESVEQLLAVALVAGRDAAARYTDISGRMRDGGNPEVAEIYARLAEAERDHEQKCERMVEALGIEDLPDAAEIAWRHPQVRDDRDRATNPGTATPYLALAYAVNSEELAFRYFSYVAANARSDGVRRIAEVLAKEELSHAARYRERRRRAYHEQRLNAGRNTITGSGEIHCLADLLTAGIRIERRIRNLMVDAEDTQTGLTDSVAQSNSIIEKLSQDLSTLPSDPSPASGSAAGGVGENSTYANETDSLGAIAAAAEQAFMFYDGITDAAQDESVMLKAQELTQIALDRIDALVTLLDE